MEMNQKVEQQGGGESGGVKDPDFWKIEGEGDFRRYLPDFAKLKGKDMFDEML